MVIRVLYPAGLAGSSAEELRLEHFPTASPGRLGIFCVRLLSTAYPRIRQVLMALGAGIEGVFLIWPCELVGLPESEDPYGPYIFCEVDERAHLDRFTAELGRCELLEECGRPWNPTLTEILTPARLAKEQWQTSDARFTGRWVQFQWGENLDLVRARVRRVTGGKVVVGVEIMGRICPVHIPIADVESCPGPRVK